MSPSKHRLAPFARRATPFASRFACLALVLSLLAVAGGAAADSTTISWYGSSSPQLKVDTGSTNDTVTLETAFTVSNPRQAYLKSLPVSGNPAHNNGTAGQSGWWTEVYVSGALKGTIDGTNSKIELGTVAAGQSIPLRLMIHAPTASWASERTYRLAYSLAIHGEDGGSGSGAAIDPSAPTLSPRIVVATPPAPPANTTAPATTSSTAAPEPTETGAPSDGPPSTQAPGTATPEEQVPTTSAEPASGPQAVAIGTETPLLAINGESISPIALSLGLLALAGIAVYLLRVLPARKHRQQMSEVAQVLLGLDAILGGLSDQEIKQFIQSDAGRRYVSLVEALKED